MNMAKMVNPGKVYMGGLMNCSWNFCWDGFFEIKSWGEKKAKLKSLKNYRLKSFKSETLRKNLEKDTQPPDFLLYLLYLNIDREELALAEANTWKPIVGVLLTLL